jgi:hypothetical protein
MPVVGYLSASARAPHEHFTAAFRRGLSQAGFFEGSNAAVKYRLADRNFGQLSAAGVSCALRFHVPVIDVDPYDRRNHDDVGHIVVRGITDNVNGIASSDAGMGRVSNGARYASLCPHRARSGMHRLLEQRVAKSGVVFDA